MSVTHAHIKSIIYGGGGAFGSILSACAITDPQLLPEPHGAETKSPRGLVPLLIGVKKQESKDQRSAAMDVQQGTAADRSVTEAKKCPNTAEKSARMPHPRTKVITSRPSSLHSDDAPAVVGDGESKSIAQATGDSKGSMGCEYLGCCLY